jgi:hypothetical protein
MLSLFLCHYPAVLSGVSVIKFWDVARKMVYKLTTGNNQVTGLAWDAERRALYASTNSAHVEHGDRCPGRGRRWGRRRNSDSEDYEGPC